MKLSPKRYVDRIADLIFTVPYSVDTYLFFCDAFRISPIYDSCWRHLDQWLKELDKSLDGKSASSERVLFISTDQFWTNYLCAVAVLIAGRNASVDFAWIHRNAPSTNQPYKSFDHWQRLSVNAVRSTKHRLISLYDLTAIPYAAADDKMNEMAEQQAIMDVSYLLQKERIDTIADKKARLLLEERKKENRDAISRVATFIKNRSYDRVVLSSGGILEPGAIYRYLSSCGIPVSTLETCDVNGKMWASDNGPVVAMNTSNLWVSDEPHILSEQRKQRVQKIIEARQSPSNKQLLVEYQRTVLGKPDEIRSQLGLDARKPVVLMCPNVPFDAIFYMGGKNIFTGMWDWLIKTISYIKERKDCQFVIRCHPGEPHYKTEETTERLIAEHFKELPAHIKIVPPRAAINTYAIMQITDVGIVYASTTGLEMAIRGIPVVCGNPVQHYNRKGFTIDPGTREEYDNQIDGLLTDPHAGRLTERQVELAWCYADLYFNKWYLPFPWHVMSLWKNLKTWPMKRMLAEEGKALYGELLDRLSGKAT